MTASELIALYRDRVSDGIEPYLTTDAELVRYFREAQIEACRRAKLLRDSTSGICRLNIKTGNPVVRYSPKVIELLRAKISGEVQPLSHSTVDAMDSAHPGWEGATGKPIYILTDVQTSVARLYPNPDQDCTLLLTVVRLPIEDVDSVGSEFEIREDYQYGLINWVEYRAYSKPDTQMFDSQKAGEALARFEVEFGKKISAKTETWRREENIVLIDPIA